VTASVLLRTMVMVFIGAGIAAGEDRSVPTADGWPGTLIIVGGGSIPEDVPNALKESLHGEGSLVLIAEAASDPKETAESSTKWLAESGISNVIVGDPSLAESERGKMMAAAIDAASAVWICGGQQSRLATIFAESGVEGALQRLLQRGGTIGGTSAGAAIMSKVMIASGKEQPEMSEGWDLLQGAIVDQHFTNRNRLARLQIAVGMHAECFGVGIDEGTAVFIQGRHLRVTGLNTVSVVLAKTDYRDAEVLRLAAGEAADLTQLRRAARQRASRVDPGEPQYGGPEVQSGSLVIVGGGAMTEDVVERFLELAGGESANIVVLPTAVSREETSDQAPGFLKKEGAAKITVLPHRGPDEVANEEFRSTLKSATGIWFGGGRQWNFVDAYEGTEAVELFRDVLRRGGVIGGSSAGATIQGEFLVRGHPLGNTVMMAEGYERGFAFLPGMAIDQHFSQRDRLPDLLPVIRRHPKMLGVGIDEGTAIVVTGTRVEVIGQHSAHFVSAKQLTSIPAEQELPSTADEAAKLYVSIKTGESGDLKALTQ
jgi:cyanophycinase